MALLTSNVSAPATTDMLSFQSYGDATPQGLPASFFGGKLMLSILATPDANPNWGRRLGAVMLILAGAAMVAAPLHVHVALGILLTSVLTLGVAVLGGIARERAQRQETLSAVED
ncbi:hypothetical protein DQ354_17785 [Arthrobacter sp. AQ5-06]|nr:hypothetical protein DQ354_17785 [Arthrobacter sp. AQ5-06]